MKTQRKHYCLDLLSLKAINIDTNYICLTTALPATLTSQNCQKLVSLGNNTLLQKPLNMCLQMIWGKAISHTRRRTFPLSPLFFFCTVDLLQITNCSLGSEPRGWSVVLAPRARPINPERCEHGLQTQVLQWPQ